MEYFWIIIKNRKKKKICFWCIAFLLSLSLVYFLIAALLDSCNSRMEVWKRLFFQVGVGQDAVCQLLVAASRAFAGLPCSLIPDI